MIFRETTLQDAYLVDPEKIEDERGSFARAWGQKEFEKQGLDVTFVQANLARSRRKGTLRGMHYQAPPHAEAKLVRCTHGAAFDVIIDLRPDSATYQGWFGVELSAENQRALYMPEGFAHGYQTLTDDTDLFYLVSAFYAPEAERGVRYDDPAFGIAWPQEVNVISEKDQRWADYDGE